MTAPLELADLVVSLQQRLSHALRQRNALLYCIDMLVLDDLFKKSDDELDEAITSRLLPEYHHLYFTWSGDLDDHDLYDDDHVHLPVSSASMPGDVHVAVVHYQGDEHAE